MDRKTNAEVLLESVDLRGRVVVDVGCGDGSLARLMTRHGAHVTGLETSRLQLEAARAAEPAGDEVYCDGVVQALPMADGSVDVVVFFNSLHHVPEPDMPRALAEAVRVLKPDGLLYISEPLAEGAFFQLTRLIDDETVVRAAALAALKAAPGLVEERELFHLNTVRHADFDRFRQRLVAIDETRARNVAENETVLRELFETLGKPDDQGWTFEQPMRVNLLRRI